MVNVESRTAKIIGTGLIGGSLGLGLRRLGWSVAGWDSDQSRTERALEIGAIDRIAFEEPAAVTFIATPAGAVVAVAEQALAEGGVVTDVAGVKEPIVGALPQAAFIGGHPMAGSELEGLDGADPDLFVGATWVLTPTENTDPLAYASVQGIAGSLGADVVALSPSRHDELVAVVSHVPYLVAIALMNVATDLSMEHGTVLRLAAGGFRDMTRVASGDTAIWPDVCLNNATAIKVGLEALIKSLDTLRSAIDEGDGAALQTSLERGRRGRGRLRVRVADRPELAEVLVPVVNRPSALAEVAMLLGEVGINIYDVDLLHSVDGGGELALWVSADAVPIIRALLSSRGLRPVARWG